MENLIEKIKQSGLTGRSGSGFPTGLKWEAVKKAGAAGIKKYAICNASEGEPGVFKDEHILKNYPGDVAAGLKLAMNTIGADTGYVYLNPDYYRDFKDVLGEIIKDMPIELFRKPPGYLCGEETTLLNVIEGKAREPRQKPPYPTTAGLWGKPTLINNVETLYWVSQISQDKYKNTRFFSIGGSAPNKGVFELPENSTANQILKQTNNIPEFDYFMQIGGGASGQIALEDDAQANERIAGIGSIIIYNKNATNPMQLMKKWAKFFLENNCDRCAPCREGVYRIYELLNAHSKEANPSDFPVFKEKKILEALFLVMEKTSFCPLGKIAVLPFKTALEKLF